MSCVAMPVLCTTSKYSNRLSTRDASMYYKQIIGNMPFKIFSVITLIQYLKNEYILSELRMKLPIFRQFYNTAELHHPGLPCCISGLRTAGIYPPFLLGQSCYTLPPKRLHSHYKLIIYTTNFTISKPSKN